MAGEGVTLVMSKPVLAVVAALAVLSACGTPEYRLERKHCEAEWLLNMPPVYEDQIVTRHQREERPTGETLCETEGSITRCMPVMEVVSVPYPTIERVDIRKAEREPQIDSCAARACLAIYGNSQCKI